MENKKILNKEIKIKEKKINDLIKILDKSYKNKFIHISPIPFNIENFKNTNKINYSRYRFGNLVYYNPVGLWFSCGSNWLKWVKSWNIDYTSQWTNSNYIYEIETNKDTVIHIKTYKELVKFHKKFAKYSEKKGYYINWNSVKKIYDGIVICPYLGNKIWNKIYGQKIDEFEIYNREYQYIKQVLGKNIIKYPQFYLEWYRHWETSTGVIWRKNGIKNINLILDLSTK